MIIHDIKSTRWAICALGLMLMVGIGSHNAYAGQYEFIAAPQTDLNRVYRVDKLTGEMGACQYGLKEGSLGVTLCYATGEGAGRQDSSEYALVASRHERESGVFRVDQRTGVMSICYVYEEKVVCTPPEKSASNAARVINNPTTGYDNTTAPVRR